MVTKKRRKRVKPKSARYPSQELPQLPRIRLGYGYTWIDKAIGVVAAHHTQPATKTTVVRELIRDGLEGGPLKIEHMARSTGSVLLPIMRLTADHADLLDKVRDTLDKERRTTGNERLTEADVIRAALWSALVRRGHKPKAEPKTRVVHKRLSPSDEQYIRQHPDVPGSELAEKLGVSHDAIDRFRRTVAVKKRRR